MRRVGHHQRRAAVVRRPADRGASSVPELGVPSGKREASTRRERAGPWAVAQVQKWGGVLEHPARSSLWKAVNLPRPGAGFDQHGGFSLDVDQHWWGHRAQKRTWLYVCGIAPLAVPAMPLVISRAPCVITNIHGLRAGQPGYRPEVTKRERDATPPAFAAWLLNLAALCRPNVAGQTAASNPSKPQS